MQLKRWLSVALVGLLMASLGSTPARAQSVEELKRRVEELERSTREQVESLKRTIEQREAERARERQAQEERERAYQTLKEAVERQQLSLQKQEERVAKVFDGWENFFDLQAGSKQGADFDRNPLGKDIQGNVFTSDAFKIKLGGSLRLHVQHNDTPVGESVASALLPNAAPGGGNPGGRDNFRAFAGRSRLNLAIQGPDTLGGKTSGFFEMDFNQQANGPGEGNAVNNNPRLRHAFGRWTFPDVLVKGNELQFTLGQTTSFADNFADTIDFNNMLGGLGGALRRNPRIEIVDRYPLTSNVKFLTSLGFERPFFDNQALGGTTDLGSGDLSGFPAVSGGIGLEAGRLGGDAFGIGSTQVYIRTTWGEFQERFNAGTFTPNFSAQTNFQERNFTNQVAHGTFILDRIGAKTTGRALTAQLRGGAVWTRGEARITNSEFDRRVILDSDGTLKPAQSVGAWINPIFFLTDTLSLRWAGGFQTALDNDRPAITGSFFTDALTGQTFFRVNNRQSEVSLWWTPGPFTFAIGWNFTKTDFRRKPIGGGSESRTNENNKVEFISWWSF